jgi:hypothetical protein
MDNVIGAEEREAISRSSQTRARGVESDSRDALGRRHDVAQYAERRRNLHRDFWNLLYWAGR